MKLSQFKFKLPEDRIAQYPVEHRDESRLMVVHKKSDEIEHVQFKDILNYFNEKDVFVFNDTGAGHQKETAVFMVWIGDHSNIFLQN